ncbi:EAL domain-containing protein [Nitratireductor aestuarii]|uniref:EAL domain-containing protein n=1 Tax=Nitratireductor aestuarii TaxID=1735103 RepID=UPI00166804F5|nr:EAL domain-containing protein [Nitratireductor aestuarii]
MASGRLLPDDILNAIHVDEVGLETGLYGDFRLRTIYHPIFLREGREAAVPWGVEGRVQAMLGSKPFPDEAFRASTDTDDEPMVAALRGLLPMRNYLNLGIDGLAMLVSFESPVYRRTETAVACMDALVQAIADVWVEPSLVYFAVGNEVTEDIFTSIALELKFRGLQTALSDFGTEQASLSRLETLGPKVVKLESSMFARLAGVPIAVRLMTSIVERLQRDGRQVLITGIETADQLRVAVDMGANLLEGSLLRAARQAGVVMDMSPVNLAALLSGSENVVRFISTARGQRDMPQQR